MGGPPTDEGSTGAEHGVPRRSADDAMTDPGLAADRAQCMLRAPGTDLIRRGPASESHWDGGSIFIVRNLWSCYRPRRESGCLLIVNGRNSRAEETRGVVLEATSRWATAADASRELGAPPNFVGNSALSNPHETA